MKFSIFSFLSEYSTSNSSLSTSPSKMSIPRLLLMNFVYLPESDYQEKVRNNKVSVVALRVSGNSVLGQINVLDVAFEKKVLPTFLFSKYAQKQRTTENVKFSNSKWKWLSLGACSLHDRWLGEPRRSSGILQPQSLWNKRHRRIQFLVGCSS